jgi:hypothetical protein
MNEFIVNEIEIIVTNKKTGDVRKYTGLHNALLNGFEAYRTGLPYYITCYLGRDGSPTIPSMTALVSKIQVPSPSEKIVTLGTFYPRHDLGVFVSQGTFTFEYAMGAVVDTVREVGFAFANSTWLTNTGVETRICLSEFGVSEINVTADDALTVNYTMNFYVDYSRKVLNVNLDHNGVQVPTVVTIISGAGGYPNASSARDATSLSSLTINSNTTAFSEKTSSTGPFEVGAVENENGFTISQIATVPGFARTMRIVVPANKANFANGFSTLHDNASRILINFDPPIPKDLDSQIVLEYSFKNKLPSPEKIALAVTAPNYSEPAIDLVANATTRQFLDAKNFFTNAELETAVFCNLKGIDCFHVHPLLVKKIGITAKHPFLRGENSFSIRVVFYAAYSAGAIDLMLENDIGAPTTINPTGFMNFGLNGTLGQATLKVPFTYTGGQPANAVVPDYYNRWNELIFHVSKSSSTIFLNGVNVYSVANELLSPGRFAPLGKFFLMGSNYNIPSSNKNIAGLFIHRLSWYENFFVSPQGLPSAPEPYRPRTVLLLTYENGIPADTNGFKHSVVGTVNLEPTGGPNGIPAIALVNGHINIIDENLFIAADADFTLEFEAYFTSGTASSIFHTDRNTLLSGVSNGSSQATVELFSNDGIVRHSGSASGSISVTPLNAWNSWTLVRRKEGNVLKYYIAKNGVVVQTRTYEETGYSTAEFLGKLFIGFNGTGSSIWTPNGQNYKLANIRLTRGVIEYFNPAGFSVPVGLRTVIN